MKTITHTFFLALVLGCVLQTGIANAEDDDTQMGELRAKDLAQSTVTIGDEVYRVTPSTEITDKNGNPITLKQIKVDADPTKGKILFAEFEASGDELDTLALRDLPQ